MKRVELLAPAGSYDAFISAINNGANAIYLAGKNFNARNFVKNFSITEIKEMIKYAHLRDVSIYVTVNTLIKDSEINEVLNFVCELYKSGVDAILVQDLGLIDILHKAIPNLVLHASTQMNCTCLEDAIKLKNLGIKRKPPYYQVMIDGGYFVFEAHQEHYSLRRLFCCSFHQ